MKTLWASWFETALARLLTMLIIILNTMIARRQKWDPTRYAVV